jgi:two-component system chemotaxis response regulator CheB
LWYCTLRHREQAEAVESALWTAMRALEEGASLAHRMAKSAAKGKHPRLERRFSERAQTKMEHAEVLRKLIVGQDEPIEVEKNAS